jgi:dolichyl-diphosphooligosaccharide--protein glycosyltransferase
MAPSNKTQPSSSTNGGSAAVPKPKDTASTPAHAELHDYVWLSGVAFVLYNILAVAYDIRLTSIKEYGPVIHEYDPYFNYRATEVSPTHRVYRLRA